MATLIRFAFVVTGLLCAAGTSHGQFLFYRTGFSNFGLGGPAFPSAAVFNTVPTSFNTFDLGPASVFNTFGASPFGVQTFGATPALGLTTYSSNTYGLWGRRRGLRMPTTSLPGNIIISGGGSSGGGLGSDVANRFDRIDRSLASISDTLDRIKAKLDGGAAPPPVKSPDVAGIDPEHLKVLEDFQKKLADAGQKQAAANKEFKDAFQKLNKQDQATVDRFEKARKAKNAATQELEDLMLKLKQ